MGETVEVSKLAELIEETVKVTKEILSEMEEDYKAANRGIGLIWLEDKVPLNESGISTNFFILFYSYLDISGE